MIRFVYGQDEAVGVLIARLQGEEKLYRLGKTIGVVDEHGKFLGGAVFYNWDPEIGRIEMTASALNPRWFSRRTLKRFADFVYIECQCQLLLIYVRADQERVLQLLAAIGFTFTLVPRLFGRNLDGVICTLTDDDWYGGRFANHASLQEAA